VPYLAGWAETAPAHSFQRIAELVDRLARRLETALGAQDTPGPPVGEEQAADEGPLDRAV
jgi:hypothetical protein